jgi:predicted metalloprotease
MRWQGRRESDNVEDRRGQSSGLGGGGGFRPPIGGKGGIVLVVVVLVAGYYGIDLSPLLSGGDVTGQSQQQSAKSVRRTMSWPSLLRWCWRQPKITGKKCSSAWAKPINRPSW